MVRQRHPPATDNPPWADFEGRTTNSLIKDGSLDEAVDLPHDLRKRYVLSFVGLTEFEQEAKKVISFAESDRNHFYAVFCLSKSASEGSALNKRIKDICNKNKDSSVLFIESKETLGEDEFAKWVENMATAAYFTGKDNSQAVQYNDYAKQVLYKWRSNVAKGSFTLYTGEKPTGENINNLTALYELLKIIDRRRFPLSLECNFKSIDNWWAPNSLQLGVECGINRTLKGTYSSKNASLQVSLEKAWKTPDYWLQYPSEPISRIKTAIEDLIQKALKEDGRISIRRIYEFLEGGEFGFLPCNMTASFIGFLLHEYVSDKYSWSDGISSDNMSMTKMKEMVEEIIKDKNTPNPRYRDKYIVTMTPEEKSFIEGTSIAFDIPKNSCSSIESARDRIRSKMKDDLYFPLWTLSEILDSLSLTTPKEVIDGLICDYQDLANNTTSKTETDIANDIGRTYLTHKTAANDLHSIATSDNCKQGMIKYLEKYNSGGLITLAHEIDDGGQYINELKKKFSADEANWVWKKETANQQIDALILEYKIANETSILLSNVPSYRDAINAWLEKCDNIKISFETVKNYVAPDVKPLLQSLKNLKQTGSLLDKDKGAFLGLLQGYGKLFKDFYANQVDVFKKACSFYIQDLPDADQDKIFNSISSGWFTADDSTFCKQVEEVTAKYKKQLKSLKLKALWYEKTSTESPWKWSEKYQMPILAMIPDAEQADCRKIFGILNSPNASDNDIQRGLSYLQKFVHWDELNDPTKREQSFREKLLGDKSVMISDLGKLKDYLASHISDAPYHWMGSSAFDSKVNEFAKAEYNASGYTKAMDKIDAMDPNEVKKYLKSLIKNNMSVGIQIIMNN